MTLPNKITLFRLTITVLAIILFYLNIPNNYLWSLLFFLVAMFLDYLDGKIARKTNQVTALGAFLDPLVDKITIIAFLIILTERDVIPIWLSLLLIFRDLIISAFRNLALSKSISIPAKISGKIKTLFQTFGLISGILTLAIINKQASVLTAELSQDLTYYFLLIALIISYISGLLIVLKNYKKVF